MANTKFFTGKGDEGESSVGPRKVSKSDPLLELLGGVDELNSWLGFCRVEAKKFSDSKIEVAIAIVLKDAQEALFTLQAELAALAFGTIPGQAAAPKLDETKTKFLEETMNQIDAILPSLKSFIIPGASELSARLDVGRAIARRVERQANKFSSERENSLSPAVLQYLNRLSSFLFALARYVNNKQGLTEENPSYK